MFTENYEWIKDHVDIKELAKDILEKAKDISVKGIELKPRILLLDKVMVEIKFVILYTLAEEEARNAKIELEKKKTEKLLKKAGILKKQSEE